MLNQQCLRRRSGNWEQDHRKFRKLVKIFDAKGGERSQLTVLSHLSQREQNMHQESINTSCSRGGNEWHRAWQHCNNQVTFPATGPLINFLRPSSQSQTRVVWTQCFALLLFHSSFGEHINPSHQNGHLTPSSMPLQLKQTWLEMSHNWASKTIHSPFVPSQLSSRTRPHPQPPHSSPTKK